METLDRLEAGHLKAVIASYREALRAHQDTINRLNVYPVPDGDTGTNMSLTVESVMNELNGADDMASVCKAISHGSLMGARGNSGVILSQILRGMATRFEQGDGAGPDTMVSALAEASDAAYSAVGRPVEGTILTVAKGAATAARGDTLVAVLDGARDGAAEALEQTPELLPVLKQAGVVDAGGAGFVLLLDAFLHVVDGRPLPAPQAPVPAPVGAKAPAAQPVFGDEPFAPVHDEVGDLRYEVMYLLEARDDDLIPAFKDVWAGIGDSIVVVGGDGLWNCHIHTDDIGSAIEAALDAGRPRNIRVTDLLEQVEEERWVLDAPEEEEIDPWMGEPPTTAVVAVATGGGIRRIFRSLGVHQVVAGGQTMNPSTAQILEAVEAAPADEVVVLPNNRNIVPVAEQVVSLSHKTVHVVPTHGIAEGFAALLAYDPEAPAAANAAAMHDATDRVVAGEVTQAVRDSHSPAGDISAGDWLGLSRHGIEVVSSSLDEAASGLLEKLVTDGHELVTIIEGEGVGPGVTRRLTAWLGEHRPLVATEVHHGGQPLYPYLFSIE